jgi:ABC-type transport system involved in cytochrome bd biosynthesis fused ATPase/permease subunit
MKDNEYIDKDQSKEASASKGNKSARKPRKSAFAMILNGEFLTKGFVLDNLGYIFFLIFLLLVLVAKSYYGKQLSKDINQAQREVDQTTADYVESKAQVEEEGLRYKLVEKLDSTLKENQNETRVIRIKKKDTTDIEK